MEQEAVLRTAEEVKDSLIRSRWKVGEFIVAEEVGQDAQNSGRRADLVIRGIWASHGHGVDAVEVKVSSSDLISEVRNPEKSQFWVDHSHRYWLAAPLELAKKHVDDIPPNWGVLGCATEKVRVLRKAPLNTSTMSWTPSLWIGFARQANNLAGAALQGRYNQGRSDGYAEGVKSGRREGAIPEHLANVSAWQLQRWMEAAEKWAKIERFADADRWQLGRMLELLPIMDGVLKGEMHGSLSNIIRDLTAARDGLDDLRKIANQFPPQETNT